MSIVSFSIKVEEDQRIDGWAERETTKLLRRRLEQIGCSYK